MFTKYTYPIYIYLFFKNIPIQAYFNNSSSKNTIVSYIPSNYINNVLKLMKNDLFLSNSYISEATAFDFYKSLEFLSNNYYNGLVYNLNVYLYNLNTRILFLTNLDFNNIKLTSSDSVYMNLNWLEREVSEMYGIYFSHKLDCRKLLLDYSKQEYPLLKSYPCEGYNEVFYSLLDNQVIYNKNEIVEL